MRAWIVLPIVLSAITAGACGDNLEDPTTTCLPDGVAEGETMLRGEPLGPFVRAAQITLPPGSAGTHALLFDEVAGACGDSAATGKHLVLLLCAPPAPGTYRIVGPSAYRCPGADVLAVVEKDGPTDFAIATTGELTLESVVGCVRGTYAAELGGETIGGMFDAVVCAD